MIDLHQFIRKAKKLDMSDWRRFALLCFGAFVLGFSFTFLDIGVVSLFLQKNTFYAVGFDFLMIGLCLVFCGSITVKLDRRHGYGGVPLTCVLTLILFGLLKWVESDSKLIVPVNLLFCFKYVLPLLVSVSFWTIASRFIVLELTSLKYLGTIGSSLLGFFFAGWILFKNTFTPYQAVMGAFFGLVVLTVLMKILVWLLPQPTETFVHKTGGVQDPSDRKMIDCILTLAFSYTVARGLGDYLLYQYLNVHPDTALSLLAYLWMLYGSIGFCALILLSYTHFLYTTLWGLFTLGLGFLSLAEGIFLGLPWMLYTGVVTTWICAYFYWSPYLSLLPRPLTLGDGIRLRKLRQMMMEPVGFILVGAFILTLPNNFFIPLLAVLALFLIVLVRISVILYNQLLLRLCKRQMWCGGPLMLLSGKLIGKVKKGAQSDRFHEAIYFLRIMEVAHFPGFQRQLIKTLHHSLPVVRLFALDKLDSQGFYNTKTFKEVRDVFQKEGDTLVRARALSYLVRYEGDHNPQKVYHKYGAYLDDKEMKIGAIMGFLQAGGEWALLAMDGLQKMVLSHQKKDNLAALAIIDRVPQKGLVRLVTPLLKHSDPEVVRAALVTAGRIGHVQDLSFVFQALDKPDLQEEAFQALTLYGKKIFPPVEKMLSNPNVSINRRKGLIWFLGLLPSREGKQVLLRSLYLPDIKLRKEVLKAILDSKIIWVSPKRKKILLEGIKQDILWWHLLNKNIQLCRQTPVPVLGDSFGFLRRSFDEMRQDLRTLILGQLILLKPNALVKKTVTILRGLPSQRFISAASILQDLLPGRFYRLIKPVLLAPLVDTGEEKSGSMDEVEAKHFLEQLILNPPFPTDRWMVASALYGLQKIGDQQSEIVLDEALSNSSPVVLEAALEVLAHLKPNKKDQELYLKHQLQQVPKKLNLEAYLKRRKDDYI